MRKERNVPLPGFVRFGRPAFTLVELLVVIGIIAVLIGILLPALNRVRENARAAACSSNQRSIGQMLAVYRAENKDYLPYGFTWNRVWTERTQLQTYTTFPDAASYRMQTRVTAMANKDRTAGQYNGIYSQMFKCPSFPPAFDLQPVQYGWHSVAMPSTRFENRGLSGAGLPGAIAGKSLIPPARGRDLYSDNALIWDTNGIGVSVADTRSTGIPQMSYDYSGIDLLQLMFPQDVYSRYRFGDASIYSGDPLYDENLPILMRPRMPGNDVVNGANGDDPDETGAYFDNIYGARFRHGKNQVMNVANADSSVVQYRLFPNQILPGSSSAGSMKSEFLRKYLLIKKPSPVNRFY
jgi:prepilin-type N-terminal cleavage/methylation domain-containing protein